MDLPLPYFSLSYSIEASALSLPLLNSVATIIRPISTCVTLKTTIKKGVVRQLKKSNFRRFRHRQFSYAVGLKWTQQSCHLAMGTPVSPLYSQWHYHCHRMPLEAQLKSSRSVRGPGPLTNIWSVSAAQQSTVGPLTAINSPF